MKKYAIIVAGGKGKRMNTGVPKQFIDLAGKPILMHTLETFATYDSSLHLIVVLPTAQIDFWERLCTKHHFNIPHLIVEGGEERFDSVKNGLQSVEIPALVAVHDGVRPLISLETISRCFTAAEKFGTAVPVVDSVDSIREINAGGSRAVDRHLYKLVQTPQVFNGELLKRAYRQSFSSLFTDDASVVENLGEKITLVEGNRENIKITTPFDLTVALGVLK